MNRSGLGLAFFFACFAASHGFGQVTNPLPGRSLVKLVPDYSRSRVYALNRGNGSSSGTLLALNSTNGSTIGEITVDVNPTDMTMTPAGEALYVINTGSRTISKVNLDTFSVAASKVISTPGTYDIANPLHLAVGRSNLVYFTNGGWAPNITTFDFVGGTNVAVYDDGEGVGGLATTRDGKTLYSWRQYGWGAGNVNSWVTRYNAQAPSLTPLESSFVSWRRDPFDTPILLNAAETLVFNKQQMFVATNVTVLLSEFSENIYAISLDGSLAFGPTKVFNTQNGATLTNLPFSTTVQTLSGDQKKLFRYNSATSNLVVYDMTSIAPVTGPAIVPTPVDGSVVGLPPLNLLWTASPIALAYDVYFGTNQAQVAAATPSSAQYLGRVNTPGQPLSQTLSRGTTYFWRVDVVGFSVINAGPVWSFTVSPLAVSPTQFSLSAIAGFKPPADSLNLTSAVPMAWTAKVTGANWLALSATNGVSPSSVTVNFNTTGLAAGLYTNTIEVGVGSLKIQVPVAVDIKPLNIVKMAADYERPYIYALQAPAATGQNGLLLFINTATEAIEKALPIGVNPVDLTMHYGEGHLYIASWTENATYVVDLATQALLPPLHLGGDVYKINAGKPGRIITEGEDQWIGVNLVDTATGAVVAGMPWPQRQGDGEANSSGTVYYHCDDNISNAHIHKYQITGDTATEVAGSNEHPYGSRNLVLAPDGTRLFWRGYVYDANLNESGNLGEEIYATTAHGDLALGGQHVFNAGNGQSIYTWPFSTSVMAVSGDQQKVFLYDGAQHRLVVIPMSQIANVPGPGLNPTPADKSVVNLPLTQLSWTVSPFAVNYRVFFGTDQAAVASATTNSSLYLGTTSTPAFSLPTSLNPGASYPGVTYYWRVDVVGLSATSPGPVWSFTISPLAVSPAQINVGAVVGVNPQTASLSLTSAVPLAWSAKVTGANWLTLNATNGVSSSSVVIVFSTAGLTAGSYTNAIEITVDTLKIQVPVTLDIAPLNIIKLVPDYQRPYIYALQAPATTGQNGLLLSINTETESIEKVVPMGINPTDMAMTPAGEALYVINAGGVIASSRTISKVDLDTFSVAASKVISTPGTYDIANPLHLAVGRSNLVYFTNGGWAPNITTFDYVGGTNVAVYDDGEGVGGLAATRDGKTLYSWRQYGWGAGNVNSWVTRYNAQSPSLTPLESSFVSWRRDPFDTPILLNAAETSVFNKQQKFVASNVSVLQTEFSENIYAISLDGSLAFGPTKVFNTQNGAVLTNLPFSTTVQTLSGDQKKLFRYDSATRTLVVYDMADIAPITGPALVPTPADDSVVGLPPANLLWTVSPIALAYDVYFGSNRVEVAAATPSSPQYVGRVDTPGQPLSQTLSAGTTYYWRVDVVGFSVTNAGPVWSFTVSPLAVSPTQFSLSAIAGFNPPSASLTFTSAVPMAWTAKVTGANWLALSATNGVSPSAVAVNFNTAALAAGLYTNTIEVSVGSLKIQVPVTVDIKPLNIVKMAADYERSYIYALQAPAATGQNGLLLFINTATEAIEKALPIGVNPVDLTMHYGEGRLYIASWTENATYVVDLATQALLPPLHLGGDVYKINAGKPGRIITEGEDQWIGVNLVDTATGAVVAGMPYPQRQGDGEANSSGTVYYHCDDNISNAHIHKYQITGDTAAEVAGSLEHPYGSRNLVLAPDGTRLFWRGYVYDANLNESGNLGEEIYTTTAHGDLALGGQHVFNAGNGQSIYTWPFSTSVMAVSGDQQKVFLYDGAQHRLVVIPMSQIANVPGPGLNPTPADKSVVNLPLTQLSWTVSPFAVNYRVFFGTDQAAVASATTNSSLYLGTTSTPAFSLPTSLNPGLTYYWRVDSVGLSAVTPGAVWSFTTSIVSVSPQSLSVKGVVGLPILPLSISLNALGSTPWTLSIAQPWLSASVTNGATPSSITLNFNTTSLAAGLYTNLLSISANGVTLQFPVTVQLFDLVATRMTVDPNRNCIYVLHAGSGNFDDAFLLFLNTETGLVEKVIPIGSNPTDLTVNRYEDRLYVSNWQRNQTRVVDLLTRTELPSLALGTDVYKINAGLARRIVVEGEDQWITASLINSTNGSTLATAFLREGDGECDPSGRYYYHTDNNSSGAVITKFDMGNDSFVSLVSAGPHYYYGSRNLVMSLDGSRLFWTSAAYDANLVDLGVLGAEIYACTTNGSVAFSDHQAFDTATKKAMFNLPVTTSVMVVDRLNQHLWYFNAATHRIGNVPLGPTISVQPQSQAVRVGSNVTFTTVVSGVSPLSYQWNFNGTSIPGATNTSLALSNVQLTQAGNYSVLASNMFGSIISSNAILMVNRIAALFVSPASGLTCSGSAGGPFNPASQVYVLTNSGGSTLNWIASKNASWVTLSATNGSLTAGSNTTVTVSLHANANGLPAGSYADSITFTNVTNGVGTTNRTVSLIVKLPPWQQWQMNYHGCTNCPQAASTADPDGDGQNNLMEFLAGTDPTNSTCSWRIQASPTNGLPPLTVGFVENSTEPSITNRLWSFGDGGVGSGANPSHTYTNAGTFSVSVTIFNLNGTATLVASNLITVCPPPPPPYVQAVTDAGPVAWWRLNETNGATVAADFFGSHNGTIGASVTPGVSGPQNPAFPGFEANNTAMQFNYTSGSYLTMPALNLKTNTVTITGWVNPTGSQAGWTPIAFCRGGNTVAGLNFGPGSIPNELRYHWNNSRWDKSTGLAVPTNQWSFVALVVTPTNATIYLGTNGVLNAFTDNASLPSQAFDASLLIGFDPSSGSRLFRGAIDEVAVYNHSLTSAQIQQLYTSAVSAPPPPLTPFQTWQLWCFGCTNCPQAAAAADPDGDGMTNLKESQAGTDPNKSASVLRIIEIAQEDCDVLITWTAMGGKRYLLETATSCAINSSNDFVGLDPAILAPGTGETTVTVLHTGAATNAPARFYRVRLLVPVP